MTLKRKNAEMDRNSAAAAAANNYTYYKDAMNYVPSNTSYSDIYQPTYPFEDEIKDKRYQLPTAAGPTYQQTQPIQQQPQQAPQPLPNIQYSQNYAKTDYHQQPSYKSSDKSQSVINPYANYTYPNYKDNGQYVPPAANYYDQYKFNMSLGATAANYGKTSKDTNYHQNFSPGLYADAKLGAVSYCDEANPAAKSSHVKPPANSASQMSQYPMYANCYGYPTQTSFPNQNYCAYAQSCSDDARMLWDEYPASRRLMSSYVATATAAPTAPVPAQSMPPQTNCRLKTNYNGDYYGPNAVYHAYHAAEGMRNREKLIYPMNSHVPTENMYNSRSRCLPLDYKYHQAVPQNMMMTAYDHRYNFVGTEAQNFDYCSQRQDNGSMYHHPAYGKPSLVATPSQKHIRPPAALANDYCNTQTYYVCNDQMGAAEYHQDPYTQQFLRSEARHNIGLNMNMGPGVPRNMPMTNDIMSKEAIYTQPIEASYYTNNSGLSVHNASLSQSTNGNDKSKSTLGKEQNLREFLASWNEDEDDGCEKIDENENQLFLQQTNIEVENGACENHLQFKGSFNTRPKIHVGITVDSNVTNNQYINLPDIIIDIEKPKETDLISHSIGTAQNGTNEKLVLLESVDIPVNDLAQYTNINLLDASIEGLDTFSANTVVANEPALCAAVVASPEEIIHELTKEVTKDIAEEAMDEKVVIDPVVGFKKAEKCVESNAHAEDSRTLPKKRTRKEKRRKRINRAKTLERNKPKCRIFGKIIKSRSGKLIRIRKVSKRIKRRHVMATKKTTTNTAVVQEHSKEETEKQHSSYNPKTLKDICIGFFNSQKGWDTLLDEHHSSDEESEKDTLDKGEMNEVTEEETKPPSPPPSSPIPKLSALCEYALNNFYEEKNILLLNLHDLDSNLYFIECDINENVVSAGEDNLNGNDFIELFIDDEMDADDKINTNNNNSENVDDAISTLENDADVNDDCFNSSSGSVVSTSSNNNNGHSNILDNSLAEICLTSDENSRDFSALHHEEIVPDNLHAYENEKLLKYLQNKYTYKSNYLKIFIIDKICKKYRKYVLKRRKNQKHHHQQQQTKNQMTKKLLVSKLKEKFIKRSKHLKIGSSC